MADERKRTIYLQEKFLQAVKDRGIENLSGYINNISERYLHMVNICMPSMDAEDYTELFEHLADHEFGGQDIEIELISLPVILEFHDVSEPVVVKVREMGDLQKLALMDLIERSQNKLLC